MSPDDLVQCVNADPVLDGGSIRLVKGQLYWVTELVQAIRWDSDEPEEMVRVRSLATGAILPTAFTAYRKERFRPFGGIKQTETDQGEISRVALETWRELHPEIVAMWNTPQTFNCRCAVIPWTRYD